MSGFSLKPTNTGGDYDGPTIDWAKVAEQVEDGTQPARVSLIVDLGIQKRAKGVSYENKDDITIVDTEDEREALMDEAEELIGEYTFNKNNLGDWDDAADGKFSVPFRIYDKKDAQEIAIFADLPDTEVVYVEGEEPKQYRIMLNPSFKGEIGGFALTAAKPKKEGDPWTFGPTTKLAQLAKATGHDEILDGGEHNQDIGRVLGEPFLIEVEKKGSFINGKKYMKVMKGMVVSELDNDPVGITFDNATVELLEAAKLRKGIIDKIKAATNYEGSAMQEALEAMEANRKSNKGMTDEDGGEGEAKPARKRSQKPSKPDEEGKVEDDTPTRKRRAKKVVEPEPEDDDGEDDEDKLPF